MLKEGILVALLAFPLNICLSLRSTILLYTYNLGGCYQIDVFYLFDIKENYFMYVFLKK